MKHYNTIEEALPFLKKGDWVRTNGLSYDTITQSPTITFRGKFMEICNNSDMIFIEVPRPKGHPGKSIDPIPHYVHYNGKNWIEVGTEEEIMSDKPISHKSKEEGTKKEKSKLEAITAQEAETVKDEPMRESKITLTFKRNNDKMEAELSKPLSMSEMELLGILRYFEKATFAKIYSDK
jgi:hypothetical protein